MSDLNDWDKRLSEQFDLKGVGDISLSHSYNRYLYRIRKGAFARTLKLIPNLAFDSKVIDLGSGTGFYIERLLAAGFEDVQGRDLAPIAVQRLTKKFPEVGFAQMDIGVDELAPIQIGMYDLVTCMDVLFHIIDDGAHATAIHNIANFLKVGGHCIISENLCPNETLASGQRQRSEHHVLTTIHEAGMEVVSITPMFFIMNDVVRWKNRFLIRLARFIHKQAAKSELKGHLLGAALLPIDLIAIRLLRRGPTTEYIVCRKIRTVNEASAPSDQ